MKAKYIIAAFLTIAGLMVVTYAQTRYWTTQHLAADAQKTMLRIIDKDGLYAERYPERLPSYVTHAMHSLGGRYNWHNEGNSYTVYGVAIILLGYAVARTREKAKQGEQEAPVQPPPVPTPK